MPNNFDYFLCFFREKISQGEKQINLIKSGNFNKSPSWMSKLYRGEVNRCSTNTQKQFAQYFKITYEQMIEEGRIIYEAKNPDSVEYQPIKVQGKDSPKEILLLLDEALKREEKKIEKLENIIFVYQTFFKYSDKGISFFDANRGFVFSTNKWGLLDGIDLSTPHSLDRILITLRPKILSFDDVVFALLDAYDRKIDFSIDVKTTNGNIFNFAVHPLFREDVFLGCLLINSLKNNTVK
jgi:hypothetical protein